MPNVLTRLDGYWKAHEIDRAEPVSESEIREFENKYRVALPQDLKEFYMTLGGISGTDHNIYCIWPLSDVKPLTEVYPEHASLDRSARDCFLFADLLISAPDYSVKLQGSDIGSIRVEWSAQRRPVVANSFSGFVELYMKDDDALLG